MSSSSAAVSASLLTLEWRRRVAAFAGVVALVTLLAQGWVPNLIASGDAPYWASAAEVRGLADGALRDPGRVEAERAGIDVDEVIGAVRHRVQPVPGRPSVLEADDDVYQVRFEPAGFRVSLENAALGVSLHSVTRGGRESLVHASSWQADGNVARRSVGSGIVEQVSALAGELEWDVVLAAPPPGDGALRVQAALTGVRSATSLDGAWRFTLGDGARVRMGEMAVIDATGAELHRALPAVDDSVLLLEVPESVLTRATYPLTIDPTVGPEVPVTGPLPAPGAQNVPALAFDGTNYLVVWEDSRFSIDIRGARVSPEGTVLDPQGIAISAAASDQTAPAVAFDGTNYLVTWADGRGGTNDVYGARVSTAGALLDGPLDTGGIAISTAANAQRAPAVGFDGTNYLVTWADARAGTNDIYAARVSPVGVLLDGPPDTGGIPISTAPDVQSTPAVAFDGVNYLVAWADRRAGADDIYAARIITAGVLLDGPSDTGGIAISTAANEQTVPAVAFNGTNYLITWADRRGPTSDIFAARVSPAGVLVDGPSDTGGIAVSTAASAQQTPDVASDGTDFLVAWRDFRGGGFISDVFAARVSGTGALVDGPADSGGIAISIAANNQKFPAIGFDGSNYLVAWGDDRTRIDDVFGARVSTAGALLDGPPDTGGIILSTGPSAQGPSAVAFDGTNYLVVWADYRSGAYNSFEQIWPTADIVAARVTPSGEILDPVPIVIDGTSSYCNCTLHGTPYHPPVGLVFDGTNYFVAWSSTNGIVAIRLSPAGDILDSTPIPIYGNLGGIPSVAFDGTNYLIVWVQLVDSVGPVVRGTLVSRTGAVVRSDFDISTKAGHLFYSRVAVAFGGTNYLVVWSDLRTGGTAADLNIFGARVSTAGALLDGPPDTGGIPISTAPGGENDPSVAFDGTRYLVVWSDRRSGGFAIFGTRVTTDGAVLDGPTDTGGIPISPNSAGGAFPVVAANGAFLVAWTSGTNIVGTRVSGGDGTVRDPNGFVIGGGTGSQGRPAITNGQGNRWAVSYGHTDTTFGAVRTFMSTVAPK